MGEVDGGMKENITLIIPCYNEEQSIGLLYKEINKVKKEQLSKYQVQILFVNDGSSDGTLAAVKELRIQDPGVEYISLSRNFGKESAIFAGLSNSGGGQKKGYVVIMDADMQDPPSILPDMLHILKNGDYDSVATRRVSRKGEPPVRSFFAKRFYGLMQKISDTDIVDGARDFRLMKYSMVEAVLAMSERNRFSKGIFGWVGFKTYWYPYENVERIAGKTKWNFWSLVKYSIDGIVNFSSAPLTVVSALGILFTGISFIAIVAITIRKLLGVDSAYGWASMMCLIAFLGGVQLLCMGIIGQYVAKIYQEVKERPHYIASEVSNEDFIKIR